MSESGGLTPMSDNCRAAKPLAARIADAGLDWIVPEWPVPARVQGLVTTRHGGISSAPFHTMNLGQRSGDDRASVQANRERLVTIARCTPCWIRQVHGTAIADAGAIDRRAVDDDPVADGAISTAPGCAAVVLVADCLPILLADRGGSVVGAAHAGWRGLSAGVVEAALARMQVPAASIVAWLGPAIGPAAFEVGDEVRAVFCAADPGARVCFVAGAPGKWFADLYGLARRRLAGAGVHEVHGGGRCTAREPDTFFSYRRDRVTGRMAALAWLAD